MGTTTIPPNVYSVEPKNKLNYLSLGGKTIWLCQEGGGVKFGCCGEMERGLMLADMTLKERCSDLRKLCTNNVGTYYLKNQSTMRKNSKLDSVFNHYL